MSHLLSHSSVDGHLDCFHVLAIVNSAAMNIGVLVSFVIMVFFGFMPKSGTAWSYGSSIFSFLRNFHIAVQRAVSIYISTDLLYSIGNSTQRSAVTKKGHMNTCG